MQIKCGFLCINTEPQTCSSVNFYAACLHLKVCEGFDASVDNMTASNFIYCQPLALSISGKCISGTLHTMDVDWGL